jgi:hypothetical protein
MSGPNPPGPEESEPTRSAADSAAPDTGQTEAHSQAYSAPESEQFTELADQPTPPRWPWIVGVAAIIAAVALVASVSVLVTRTNTDNLATPATSTTTAPPVQDEITTTTPPPPPPPPTTEAPPPPPETVTVTQEPSPPPQPPAPTEAPPPPPVATEAPPPPPTTRAGPRQVTYSVTGTKAPGDIITVTYVDASGRSRTQRNVYIPWSLTVTPISQSEVGSVQASSLFLVSRLNCSITTSDGTVLSSNTNNAAQTSC